MNLIEKVKPTIEKVVTSLGYELVAVECKNQYGAKHLIVYIAGSGDISLNDCEAVSNALDAPLDALDPTNGESYCLDVSSPGLDRPFYTLRDYERNYEKKVEVKLYAPIGEDKSKLIVGILKNKTDDELTLDVDGKITSIDLKKIAVTRPYVEI